MMGYAQTTRFQDVLQELASLQQQATDLSEKASRLRREAEGILQKLKDYEVLRNAARDVGDTACSPRSSSE